jgi:hypothetical protein
VKAYIYFVAVIAFAYVLIQSIRKIKHNKKHIILAILCLVVILLFASALLEGILAYGLTSIVTQPWL